MQFTLPDPKDEIDLGPGAEKEMIEQAKIAARVAGYNSLRHFEIAAHIALVRKYLPTVNLKPSKN